MEQMVPAYGAARRALSAGPSGGRLPLPRPYPSDTNLMTVRYTAEVIANMPSEALRDALLKRQSDLDLLQENLRQIGAQQQQEQHHLNNMMSKCDEYKSELEIATSVARVQFESEVPNLQGFPL